MTFNYRLAWLFIFCCLIQPLKAAEPQVMKDVHFLIPAGPGGGWDGTARGIGEALIKSQLAENVSFENLSGGGGGRAIAKLIETAPRQSKTLLINSTPMVVRSLQKIFPQSFRDLRPVASVIADYTCFAVHRSSPFQTWGELSKALIANPRQVKVAGGSVRGSTDHFIIAKAIELAGGDPRKILYVPYDGGGKALAGILTGETQVLSSGLSETLDMARAGEVRILAVTAKQRLPEAPELPTLIEQGVDLEFANWRGFFAAPGHSEETYQQMEASLAAVVKTDAFDEIRRRNGWSLLHLSGDDFYQFLERQETEIGDLMRGIGFLR